MAKRWTPVSRRIEMTSGRAAIGTGKGNGPDRKVSVARSLENAARSTSTKSIGPIAGPSGQDKPYKTGGASDRDSGAFDHCRGYDLKY